MTFAASLVELLVIGNRYAELYKYTGADGDVGDVVQTGFRAVEDIWVDGNLASGASNVLGLSAGRGAVAGSILILYTDPDANHEGYILVFGKY